MATLALGIAGGALGGPVGQALGAAVGSYIDNQFIFPALFPQDPVQGPRIQDLQVHSVQEGAPQTRCFGAECRVPGVVIWKSNWKERKTTEEVGGKGGPPPQTQETYTYSIDVAVQFAEGPPDGNGIQEVTKVWGNTRVVYEENPDVAVSDDTLTATAEIVYDTLKDGSQVERLRRLTIKSPNGGPDLSDFRSGYDIVVDGWAETANNGTFRCANSWFNDATGESFVKVKDETAAFVDDANGGANTIDLDQDVPNFPPGVVDDVVVVKGTEAQTALSLIQARETDVPAFRRSVIVAFDDLQGAKFGNALPNFNALLWATGTTDHEGGDPETVGGALQKILAYAKEDSHHFAGLTALDFDTTAVDGITLRGYMVRGPQPIRLLLQPLMLAYDIAARESDGVVTFFERKNATVIDVDPDDLAAHPFGADAARPIRVRERQNQVLPKEVVCRYMEPEKHYQQGQQRAKRLDVATGHSQPVDLPVVLTAVEAKNIAERLLWTPAANRREVALQLPPSYFTVQEGDVLRWTDDLGKEWRVLVMQIDRGANGLVVVEGVEEVAALLSFTSKADDPKGSENDDDLSFPSEQAFELIDVACLRDADAQQPGFYLATANADASVGWGGATWFESVDDATYTALTTAANEAALGIAEDALGDVVDPDLVDRANSVQVTVADAVLSSRTGDDVLAGANRVLIGMEVFGFETATLDSTNPDGTRTYTLSDLHRALAGTEEFTDSHAAGERVVALTSPGVQFLPVPANLIGGTRHYKPVPAGGVESEYGGRAHEVLSWCVRPLSVAHFLGTREANDDWTLTWDRRTRLNVDELAADTLPLEEDEELYEVEVRNVSTGAVVNVYETSEPTFTYTDAQQTADFGSAQATVRIAVFQMSALIGRGAENEQTFTG